MDNPVYFQANGIDLFSGRQETLVGKVQGSELVRLDFVRQQSSVVANYLVFPSAHADFVCGSDFADAKDLASRIGALVFEQSVADATRYGLSLERLRSLKVLDLGCGSEISEGESGLFAPHLCRQLNQLGVNATGVDINYPRYEEGKGVIEEWKHVNLNLRAANAFSYFGKNEFDIVWCNNLIEDGDSSSLSPTFFSSSHSPAYDALEERIFAGALTILKPAGLFIVNKDNTYQKVQDGIVSEFVCLTNPAKRKSRVFDFSLIIDA